MSTLDNLTGKILADSEAEAAAILAEARAEAARVTAAALEDAAREKEKLLAEAKTEAAREEEQIIVGRKLAERDRGLSAKQQMLDKVFAEALKRLEAMSKAEFFVFVTNHLKGQKLDGEEIILPARYSVTQQELDAALEQAGIAPGLKLAGSGRAVEGGFVLSKGGIERNSTFEALLSFYRYDLESAVLEALY